MGSVSTIKSGKTDQARAEFFFPAFCTKQISVFKCIPPGKQQHLHHQMQMNLVLLVHFQCFLVKIMSQYSSVQKPSSFHFG